MTRDHMTDQHVRDRRLEAGGGMVEDEVIDNERAWHYHERLLDALHEALDGAERLSPLNDGCSLAALDALLIEAAQAIRGLRGQGAFPQTSLQLLFRGHK